MHGGSFPRGLADASRFFLADGLNEVEDVRYQCLHKIVVVGERSIGVESTSSL